MAAPVAGTLGGHLLVRDGNRELLPWIAWRIALDRELSSFFIVGDKDAKSVTCHDVVLSSL